MSKQTAVEWLVEQLRMQTPLYTKEQIIEIAKEMEKQQIIDAYLAGMDTPHLEIRSDEEYFNDTYKGGKK
jgi:hypothetical protein